MIWPPSVVRLRIYENSRRKMNLWLPVCALWPPVVLIALLLAPVAVPVLWLAAGRGRRRQAVMAGPVLFRLPCSPMTMSRDVCSWLHAAVRWLPTARPQSAADRTFRAAMAAMRR